MKKIYLAILSFVLLCVMFGYIHFLTNNNYIAESFDINYQDIKQVYQDKGLSDTTHTVSLPLTSTYSCQNFCGPSARCSITGQQCAADIDCPGCNPYKSSLTNEKSVFVRGNNDAGILTNGVTPRYSTLTTDIGTQAKLYTSNKLKHPAMPSLGVNTWVTGFNESMEEFDKRYKPYGLQFTPDYKKRYTLSGQFMDNGPLASNAYI